MGAGSSLSSAAAAAVRFNDAAAQSMSSPDVVAMLSSSIVRDMNSMKEDLEKTKQQLEMATSDRSEVLRLLELMAETPVDVNDVLETYLSQYGELRRHK